LRPFGNDHRSARILRAWLLHFTRAEKRGISVFLLLIIAIWILPGLWKQYKPVPGLALLLQQNDDDSAHVQVALQSNGLREEASQHKAKRHEFNPNLAEANELLGLGFSPQTVRRLLRYREKGGVFRKKEDLLRIWGVDSNLVVGLFPFIKVAETVTDKEMAGQANTYKPQYPFKPIPTKVDVNSADSFALQRLPGIGPKLAARIVAYRDKLGGFHSLAQLQEVYGLNPETLMRLNEEQLWHIGRGVYRKIAINRADASNLRHPYISRKQAGILEAYRKQHGLFMDSSAMNNVLSFSAEELRRLFPYLDFSR
jgi:competence ComEA-like helix-hairpin-helix protein